MNRIKNLGGALSIAIILCPASPAKAQQGSCVAPPPGLVGWWRGETNAQDSVGSNNGTLLNGAGFASGEVGQAFNFSGNNAVQIPYSASLTLSNYTMEAWIKPLALPNNLEQQSIIFGQQYGLGSFMIRSGPAGVYAVLLFDTPSVYWQVVSSNQLSLGQFSHVVGSWDGTTLKIYVNGQLQGQSTPGATPSNPGTPFYIGGYVPNGIGTMLFNGVVDEVSLYNRGLSGAEVASIYNAGSAGKCVGPTPPPAGGEVILGPITNAANGHAYYLLSPSTWMEAEAKGVSLGGHLVTINDASEDNWVFTTFSGFGGTNTHLWIGFTDQAQEGNFVWISGQPVTYTHWSNGEPNNWGSGENYGYIFSPSDARAMTWNDAGPEAVDPLGVAVRGVLEIAPPVGCVAPPSGLAGWWRGEANAQDFTGNNNGTLLNGAGFASGEVGQAFNFSGNNAVEIPYSASLALSNYSMEAWIKPAALPNNGEQQSIIFGQQYGQGSILIRTGPAGVYAVLLFDTPSAYWQVVSTNQLPLGQFSHVVGSWDGITLKIYVNGQLQGQSTPGATPSNPGTSWFIGAYVPPSGGNQYFNGLIDEVSFYNRPLSGAEVASLYNAGSAGKCTGPIAPSITGQPSSLTVASGNDAVFNVIASGNPSVAYQWWSGSGAITNATNATLTLTNVQSANSGDYYVVVTNLAGSTTSSNATLTVTNQSPFITVQPQGSNVVAGSGVSFAVVAGGSKPLSYQWRLDTTNIAGATGNSYTIPAVQPSDAGTYSVVVSNQFDSVLSSNAVLMVVVLPKGMFDDFEPGIDQSQWAAFGGTVLATNYGGSVSPSNSLWFGGTGSRFAMTRLLDTTSGGLIEFYLRLARGTLFPWETVDLPSEGVVLEYSANGGAGWIGMGSYNTPAYTNWTLISLAIPQAAKTPATQFRWRQLGNSGSSSDHWALDDVGANAPAQPPRILVPPTNATVVVGQTATFSVSAGGTTPLAYQWRLGAMTITNATNALLTLTNVQIDQEGYYSVLITNVAGTTNSTDVFLNVTYPPAVVRVANTTNISGTPVTIPVILAANGDESGLSFSLNFNTAQLTFASVDPGSGASGASLLANTNQIGSGRIGVTMAVSSGTFDPGEREVALVTFNTPILIGESSVTADVTFTNQPITGLLSDAGAQPLPVVFAGGTVTLLPSVLEGDAAPRPAGNHSPDIFDWVQVGRFVAALDSPTNSGEFQRVDCAPRIDLGDGQLKVTDWVQAGRYAAVLDPVTLVGGPASPVAPLGLKSGFDGKSGSREVRVSDGTAVEGVSFTLPVNLQALGDENALGFSLLYDPMKLSYSGASKGSAATTTTLNVNTNQTVAGKVGFVLALPAGNQFAAGTRELIRVTFKPSPLAVGTNVVAFGDQPVIRSISDPTANELGSSYMANSLAVNPLPALGISLNAQQAVVSWPVWAEGFELQAFGGGSLPATTWTNVSTTIQTNGNNAVVTVPLGETSTYFRLVHP